MEIAIHKAKAKLTKLVSAVEAGDTITITRHGVPVVDLVIHQEESAKADKAQAIREMWACAKNIETSAAQAADFLYDDDGLPK